MSEQTNVEILSLVGCVVSALFRFLFVIFFILSVTIVVCYMFIFKTLYTVNFGRCDNFSFFFDSALALFLCLNKYYQYAVLFFINKKEIIVFLFCFHLYGKICDSPIFIYILICLLVFCYYKNYSLALFICFFLM